MPLKKLRRWPQLLQVRLTVLAVLAMLVAVGLSQWMLLRSAEAATLQQRAEQERTEARRIAGFLDRSVQTQIDALALISRSIGSAQLQHPDGLREQLRAQTLLLPQFNRVFVAATDGRLLVNLDNEGQPMALNLRLSERNYFLAARDGRRAVVSELVIGQASGEPLVVLAQPLIEGERVIGVLGGAIQLRHPPLLTRLGRGGGRTAQVMLTDSLGNVLAHSNPDWIGKGATAMPVLQQALQAWQAAGAPRLVDGQSLPDPDHLLTVAALPGTGWLLWRFQPLEQVLAPLARARSQALATGAAVAALVGLALLLLLWRAVTPLRQLAQRAEHLFDPAQDPAQGWPGAGGEIGDLAAVLRRVGSERRHLEQRSAAVLGQLQTVLRAAPLGILVTRGRVFELVSPEACRMLGRREDELLGELASSIFHSPDAYAALGAQVVEAFAQHQVFNGEFQFHGPQGQPFWGQLSGHPVDWQDAAAGTVWTLNDISTAHAARAALEWRASHDPLTGLANRAALHKRLERLLAAGERARPACLLMLDLDRFKPINDRHGHAAGDAVLCAVAQALSDCVRGGDLVSRLGGDEFAVVLERCPPEVAERVAQDILLTLQALGLPWGSEVLSIGVSIGLAPLAYTRMNEWLQAGDAACYAAKAAGRNQVQCAPAG